MEAVADGDDGAPRDVVGLLAVALERASAVGRWDVVAQLARELEARRLESAGNVVVMGHRHACIVVGRAGDRELVEGIPPATPSYVGWDSNPALDGWYVHEGVFRALEEHRMSVG